MSEARRMLADTANKVLGNLPADLQAAHRAIDDAGLWHVMMPEEKGGFGGGWEDALIVLRASGFHAVSRVAYVIVAFSRSPAVGVKFHDMALARACEMAGAMQAALELTVQYARERQQFGKPLASFQAIQQQLALAAEELAATNMATAAACRAYDRGPAAFEIASAKLRANLAVGTVTSVAHQVHGAMGFTKEYKLHRLTTLLWQWRGEYGNDRYWADTLGRMIAKQGAEGFWPALVLPATIAPSGSV